MKTGKWKIALALGLLWLVACNIATNKTMEATLQSPSAASQATNKAASFVSSEYTIRPKAGGTIILASYSAQAAVEATLVPTLALPTAIVVTPTIEAEETQTVVPEETVEVSATNTATLVPTATSTMTLTPTNTPTNTPTSTFTPTPTSTPTPTNTPTPTLIPYELKWTNSIEGLNPGQYFLAPQQCNLKKRDIGIWIRVLPKGVDWQLTIKMWNVTLAQGWRTYTDVYTGKLTTTFDSASQLAVVTVPAGTSEFMLEFGSNKSCAYMGVEGKVTDATPIAAPTQQPAALLPTQTFIQPSPVPPTAAPSDGTSNI